MYLWAIIHKYIYFSGVHQPFRCYGNSCSNKCIRTHAVRPNKRGEKCFAPTKSVFIRIICGRFFIKIPVNFPLIYLWLIIHEFIYFKGVHQPYRCRGNYSQIHLFYRCSSTLRVSCLKCYGVLFGRTRCVPTKGAKNVSPLLTTDHWPLITKKTYLCIGKRLRHTFPTLWQSDR